MFQKEHATSILKVKVRREKMELGYVDRSQEKWSHRSMGWGKGDGVIALLLTCLYNLTTSLLYSTCTDVSMVKQ
jgi:hypothetical protein